MAKKVQATKPVSPLGRLPLRMDSKRVDREFKKRMPGVFAWYDSALSDPDVPDSVKLGICQEITKRAHGAVTQSMDLTSSDGSMSGRFDFSVEFIDASKPREGSE